MFEKKRDPLVEMEKLKQKLIKRGQLVELPPSSRSPTPLSNTMEPKEKVGKQLFFWPEEAAAIPTELTRVSLFGLPGDKRGVRKIFENVKLDSRADIEVFYTGSQLGAKDETLWLACLRIGRGIPMGERIPLNITDLLREIGLSDTGGKRGNRHTIIQRLNRLSAAHFSIRFKRGDKTYRMTTGLLKWGLEEESGKMYIRLDPDGAMMFENLAYQPWEIRLALHSDLSTRLLSYVCGHEAGKSHSVKLDDLRQWCGYNGRLRDFRTACLAALHELRAQNVLRKEQIVNNGRGDVACWVRTHTAELDAKAGDADVSRLNR